MTTSLAPALPPSWQILSTVCNETGRKSVAAAVKLSAATVHKWCEDSTVSGCLNPLDRILAITRITDDTRLIEWLCAAAGGAFVRDSDPHPPTHLHTATGRCGVALVRSLEAITEAAEDGVILQAEVPVIRERWQSAKSVTEGLVRCAEAGRFR